MASERVVLVDVSALIYRAFFAIPSSFTTAAGLHTNAIYGFALMFRKIFAGKTPKFGAMVFDPPGPTFRDERYPDYKAQRPSMPSELREQLPWIDKLVQAYAFPVLRVPGFEADDVIGTLTKQALAAGHEVYIISGDKDFAQLIEPGVRMIDTMRDITYDEELVRKKWGVLPSQFVDHLAMMGDSVDNIPGVPGIGQKTSAGLLSKYGSLDGVYEHIDDLKGKQKENLVGFREQAYLSQELATIACDVELDVTLDDLTVSPPTQDTVNALYRELEFYSLLEGEHIGTGDDDDEDFGTCDTVEKVRETLDRFAGAPVAVAPMTVQGSAFMNRLVGIALAGPQGNARYVPLYGPEGSLGDAGRDALRAFLEDPDQPKVAHDVRDTWCLLKRHGIDMRGVVGDTQLASFLVDPTGLIPHGLNQVVKEYIQRTVRPLKAVVGSGQSETLLDEVPVADLSGWACHIASAIAQTWPAVAERLESEGRTALLHDLCLPMAYVLGRMQLAGVRIDPDDLAAMEAEFSERKAEVEKTIHGFAGREFNIGSPKQLGEVLFDEMGLPVIKRTKTGYSTNVEVMERLAPEHEIARHVIRWRALDKLISTYTRVLRESRHPETGRIHATFQQTTGASGRLITTDPDLQRTPIRTEDGKRIRQAFIPRDGWVFISADWSQIELRILAHVTGDEALSAAFRDDLDLHRATAARIFDVAPESVTSEQRNMGKTVNFATIYGQGSTALGQQLGIPKKEAKQLIDRYFAAYPGVTAWLEKTRADAHERGWVETILGRRRYVPELKSNNFSDRSYGERIATNTPIQGSAADICKLAMLAIDKQLRERGMETTMMVQIHDELLFEAPPGEVEDACTLIRDCMREPLPLNVPLKVDIGTGSSWAAAH